MSDSTNSFLSSASITDIDHWIAKYPADQKQSAVMAALRIAQDQNGGWLTPAIMDEIADYLAMPKIAVYEVATFYSMYEHSTVGTHKISVCTNISCMLSASDEIVAHFHKRLGIGLGQTTADGQITLKEVECLGACVNAPVCQVGQDYHEKLTPAKVDVLIDSLLGTKD